MMKPEIIISPDLDSWAHTAANLILQHGKQALAARDEYSLVLAGGSTPRPVYQQLVAQANQLDWQQVYLFWGDERCVPPDHPESNYHMAKETLLAHLPIPQQNIFRLIGEIEPQLAAQDYEEMIAAYFYHKEKRFDTVLLGLGQDGHTASLFPGTPALQEDHRWVLENPHPYSDTTRLTLTYPALNSARQILFLVAGTNKAEIVAQAIHHPETHTEYPATCITGSDTPPIWVLDQQAASNL